MRVLVALLVMCSVAHAVEVRVVEVAGGRAYLAPSVPEGTVVTIDGRSFAVTASTTKNAVIEADGLAVGAVGDADVRAAAAAPVVERMPAPAPLSRFKGQWKDPVPPSTRGPARVVPLGRVAGRKDLRATVMAQAMLTTTDAMLALGGEVHVEPWRERPLGFDADAALLLWLGETDGPAMRPLLRVRELRLRYGGEREPVAAIGRLRWAAQTVGLLDGARIAASVGRGVTVAAFGGVVPDPLDGAPSVDVSRFGAELSWAPAKARLAQRIDVTAFGSVWDGALDERRLAASARAFPGRGAVGAHVEVSAFDVPNAWGAAPVELTAAGADFAWRADAWRVSARLDARQPERSRFLASLLPEGWLCSFEGAATTASGAADRATCA